MFNHFIQTFIDAQTAAWRHYSAVAATEKRLFGDTSTPAVRVPGTLQIEAELRHAYEALALRIIEKARDRFSVGRARPAVSRTQVYRQAGFDIERSLAAGEVPDFDLLWTVLESQLGNIGAPAGER
ncbi:hypothetical protein LMG28727_06119 [Paraburkholderia kirstenboschensis]|uniref:hypothetical protein n=1 Tax=Paraburkholderia kirstenboschensis TaxID=1245436 RepID=UPI000B181E6F|nr:hypothetical protein [Paraburkholderia kirstenboschensis]CAD6556484.1 hypothetical protein LMG28727_06119 [Paraburkholderia kirstenboschensis]